MENIDEKYMLLALKEAEKAVIKDEIPVGAIIVKDGVVVSKAYNKKEQIKLATAHAEMLVINKACKKLNSWRLNDCELYVTLEPCEMCYGAIKESRIKRLIYATEKDKKIVSKLIIERNVLKKESERLLKKFFKNKRK
jgi:tRNA(adenine34) deaminase